MNKTGDWFISRHAHSTHEFHFCARGSCMVDTDAASFMISEGYFYLSAPGIHHAQRPANSDEFIEYSLNCNIVRRPEAIKYSLGRELEQLFSLMGNSPCLPVADHFGIISLFDEALEEAEQRRLGYEWVLQSLVPRILVAAARAIELDQKPSAVKAAPSLEEDPGMARIEEYIQANLEKHINSGDMAKFMKLSEKQVSGIIFRNRGLTAKKFITLSKLKRAKELLASTDKPIKEIAANLGFSSEYYFNSVFKLYTGCPPGLFRGRLLK